MDLDRVRDFLTLAGPIAIIVGAILAVLQLRDLRRLRQMDTVMRVFGRFDDQDFQRRYQRMLRWRFRGLKDFEKRASEDDWITLFSISVFFENIGTLYKRRLAPLELLDDVLSGPITTSWQKLGPLWVEYRSKHNQPMMSEWFERLATDMEKRLARIESDARPQRARAARPARLGASRARKSPRGRTARSGGS